MEVVIAIPARYASKRFPGKPLTQIAGLSLLERVWRLASAVSSSDRVIIATEDERIETHGKSFGAEVVMTSNTCRNGSERVFEAVSTLAQKPDIVVNFQGDAVLTPPWILDALIEELKRNPEAEIATPAVQLDIDSYRELLLAKESAPSSGTTVVFDAGHRAMYFSKRVIPYLRDVPEGKYPVYRHIGIYAYRYHALERYLKFPAGTLERVEGLEQLRALENGMYISVTVVDYRGRTHWSIDSPQDVDNAEKIIVREGELIPL